MTKIISLILLSILPFILNATGQYYLIHILILSGIYIILALALNFCLGYTGLLDLGFVGFYAIGAYISAILTIKGFPVIFSIIVAIIISILIRVLLSYPIIKLKGDYFAIVTLGFGEIIRLILNNWDNFTNGPKGLPRVGEIIKPVNLFGINFTTDLHYYFLILISVLLIIIISKNLEKSIIGRAWVAIREDEVAALLNGINVVKIKIIGLVISAGIAGFAGSIYSHWIGFITPESFTFWESIFIVCMVVLGGMGNIKGVIFGAFILVTLPEILRETLGSGFVLYRMMVFGIMLILIILFRPEGIFPEIRHAMELKPDTEKIRDEEDQIL